MSHKVDNAVIMAAGTSSRFAPLSYEKPKALTVVKGEVLLERQIRQLKDAGTDEILLVCGYKKEQFGYLKDMFGLEIIDNPDYLTRNNNSTLWAVRDRLGSSYICSSDNYFAENPFESEVESGYYAAVYADGPTQEWCMTEDADGYIDSVTIGGSDAWYMLGHAFWDEAFTRRFVRILEDIYDLPETAGKLWEAIYMEHLDELKLRIRRYPENDIFEFDTLDDLRQFDVSYIDDTRSAIIKELAQRLSCRERDFTDLKALKTKDNEASGMSFCACGKHYEYIYENRELRSL